MAVKTNIWWYEYRKRSNRVNIRNMSTEIIIRKVFVRAAKEFVSESSIGGLRSIFTPQIGPVRRSIHIIVFTMLFGSIFYFLRHIWIDSLAKPFVVTEETTTYPIRNIDFPAVALCNVNRISKRAVDSFVAQSYRLLAIQNQSVEEVKWFIGHLGRLIDHSYNPSLMHNPLMMSFRKYLGNTNNIIKIMQQLAPSCKDILIKCTWSAQLIDCSKIFKVHSTIYGHCCTFNYAINNINSTMLNIGAIKSKRQISPGRSYGLNVIVNPMIDDYFYPFHSLFGFEVLIFDPTRHADPPGGGVKQLIVQPGEAVLFKVKSTKQIATSEVRKYSTKSRKCLFHDEAEDKLSYIYSYSSCLLKCRIKAMQTLCKCTPYYLVPSPYLHGPICTLDNLKCLNKYKEKFYYFYPKDTQDTTGLESEVQNSLYCMDCLPDCELTQYTTRHSKMPLNEINNSDKEYRSGFSRSLNMSTMSVISVYQPTAAGVLNRLDVIQYWYEVLSNVGGYCGILVGLSIVSVIEIIYFFIFRFVFVIIRIFVFKSDVLS